MPPQLTITDRSIPEPITINEWQQEDYVNYTATADRLENFGDYCSWLSEVREQLQAIESLPDGWDSYGAPSPDPHFVACGRRFIERLARVPNLPQPYVNPTRNGGVQFEWEVGERYFELEIVAERAAEYFYRDDIAHMEETGNVFKEDSLEQVLAYIFSVETPEWYSNRW